MLFQESLKDLKDHLTVCFQSLNDSLTNLARKIPTPPRPAMPSEELNRSAGSLGSSSQHHVVGGSEAASAQVLGLHDGDEGPNGAAGEEAAATDAVESVHHAI